MRGVTLTRYLLEREHQELIDAGLRQLVEAMALGCRDVAHAVSRGALDGVLGAAGTDNVQGEAQKQLDVIANDALIAANERGGHLAAMVSEELATPHRIPDRYPRGDYLLLVDPLDGSSNVEVNAAIGTIFSVLRRPDGASAADERAFLQPGSRQAAAGFAVYGPQTMLVISVGDGVASFSLDREIGTFVLIQERIRIPDDTAEFAINASNMRHWEAPVRRYIDECLAGEIGPRGKNFNMRWIASMVAEVFRILARGGVFLYPRDARQREGRLRLMYEANPMAYIVEQAGGAATDGRTRILDLVPGALHQRVGVVLGSRNEVARIARYHAR